MKRKRLFLIILLPLLLAAGCSSSSDNNTPPVNDKYTRSTLYGLVSGIPFANNTIAWLGIPFAKPPTKENGLRWKAPQNPEPWEGVLPSLNTVAECVPCSQMGMKPITGSLERTGPIGSEDCLILAVWRPDTDETNLPVYVWVHGGSNNVSGIFSNWPGSMIADQSNMVVVSVQYRLGTLGWLTHPALRTGEPGDEWSDSGNFGTLDVLKALEWVRDNIANFGGDPENVLLTGESSGAHDVMNLIISPLGEGLFHRVLHQSGGMKLRTVVKGEADADSFINRLLEIDGLPDVPGGDVKSYLESKSADELVQGFWNVAGSPDPSSAFRDGTVIPDNTTVATIESGVYNKVPIILGSNTDEMKYFLPYYGFGVKYAYLDPKYGVTQPVPSSPYTWVDQFKVTVPSVVADSAVVTKEDVTLDTIFPLQEDKDLYTACGAYGSLNWRVNFVDDLARAFKTNPDQPVYAYLFEWDGLDGTPYQFTWGAAHATEIPFFFGSSYSLFYGAAFSATNDTPGRQELGAAMMQYMANFARTGNPNGGDLPLWEEWSTTEGEPKRILWDASVEAPIISMGTEEFTSSDVQALFQSLYMSLPASTRNIMYWFNFWPAS